MFNLGISIHALRKESDLGSRSVLHLHGISIHALRKESDARLRMPSLMLLISIHALRKESDPAESGIVSMVRYFNPRSP